MTRPGEEPMSGRDTPEPGVPGGSPEDPNYRKPAGGIHVDVSLETAEAFLTGAKPASTECAERAFDKSLDDLAAKENPLPEEDEERGAFNP